jgi:tRNA-2-methylthio-N6-dimethylallyladenosine synthase
MSMNDHDSEKLSGLLVQEGHEPVTSAAEADLVLLNTCSIREKAVHKVYSELGRLREAKEQRPLLIGVVGCLAQQEKDALFRRAPQVDFVLGTMAVKELPKLVEQAMAGRKQVIDTQDYPDNHLFPPEVTLRGPLAKALVTIIEGCDQACTYCVVPLTRGPERHRPCADVLAEVRGLVHRGFREVELLGQNVNGYAGGCTFAELLDRVAEIDGLEWIRFTRELAQVLATNPTVAPFRHLPVQSGSDRILRRMGRQYTAAQYLERLEYLGEGRRNISLSTDFIVGFPGETEEDFEDTLRLLDRVAFDASFSFVYSPRPGTPALRYLDVIPAAVKSKRLARLQARQTELTLQSHRRMIGRVVQARIESHGPTEGGHWLARTGEWQKVHLAVGDGLLPPFGELVTVRITDAGPHFLRAELAL